MFFFLPPQTLAGHGYRCQTAWRLFLVGLRSAFCHYSRTTRLLTGRTTRPARRFAAIVMPERLCHAYRELSGVLSGQTGPVC